MKTDISFSISVEIEDVVELLTLLKGKSGLMVKMGKREQQDKASVDYAHAKYEPDDSSLIDIICSKKKVLRAVFAMLSRMTDRSTLYFNSDGIICRLITKDSRRMIDLRISKGLFDVYHVKGRIRISLPLGIICRTTKQTEKNAFRLVVSEKDESARIGEVGLEHVIIPYGLWRSECPFPVEEPLSEIKPEAEATMPFELFKSIIENARYWGSNILTFEDGKLTFSAGSEEHGFAKTLTTEHGCSTTTSSASPISCVFAPDEIGPILDNRFNVAPTIRIGKRGSALHIEPLIEGVKLSCFIGAYAETGPSSVILDSRTPS